LKSGLRFLDFFCLQHLKETDMRILPSLLLAGAAVAGLGLVAPSLARELDLHRLTVPLPGGGVETIEYTGQVAPRVRFEPVMMHRIADPWADDFFWPAGFGMPSFVDFDRIAARMDAQMAAMMQKAELLTRLPQGQALNQAVLKDLPPGTTSFSYVSTSTGNGTCTQVTRITRGAQDAKPQVVSQTSGDCGASSQAAAPADLKHASYQATAPKTARTTL
jgi:hypothetical protein